MGLDSVELLVRIENTFDIKIPDIEAEKTRTVDDLYKVVWKYIETRERNKCISQHVFYQLRNVISKELGVSKHLITPQTILNDLLPIDKRSSILNKISNSSGYKFPKLRFPHPWQNIYGYVGMASGTILFISLLLTLTPLSSIMLKIAFCSAVVFLVVISISYVFRNARNTFEEKNMKDLVYKLLAINTRLSNYNIGQKDMELIIDNTISDQLGVSIDEIKPEKRFVEDLGVS